MNTSYQPGSRRLGEDDESQDDTDGMRVDVEQGTLDQFEVEETLRRNFSNLTGCYRRAGDAQRYVGGQITLRFLVEPDGTVSDVLVIENQVGSYPIERCLVVELRGIRFRPPGGRKGTMFEYPLRFESTREMTVIDAPNAVVSDEIESLLASLTPCPPLGAPAVIAVAYVEPNGSVGSVGLESTGAVDPEAGICALEQIQKWKLTGDQGRVIRTRFRLRLPDAHAAPAVAPSAAPDELRKTAAKPKRRRGRAPHGRRS